MNLLCFDTTSRDASMAVLRDQEILLEYNFSTRDNLSAVMIPSLEFLLRSLGLKIAQIDLFGVAVGPGLFTGIRIGLATLKGLNFAAAKPMVAVNTLEALACKFADAKKNIVALIDARKGEVYLGCYNFINGEINVLVQPCLLPVAALVSLLEPISDKVFVGSGAECHGDFLKSAFGECRLQNRSNFLATEIGRIALQMFHKRQSTTDLQKMIPCYIRRPDAQSNLARSNSAVD